MSSTSVSAAAIFSAEESCGRLPKRKDIVEGFGAGKAQAISMEERCYLLYNSSDIRRGEVELYVSPIKKCLGGNVLR